MAGCASTGPTDQPIARKFQWFSYLAGEDIRDACRPGGGDRYRMVYNGVYTEQVRAYDVDVAAASLDAAVRGPSDLGQWSVSGWSDLLAPWRGETQSRALGEDELADLTVALDADGVFGPPNEGEELSSKGFFWTVAACRDGRFRFTGFAWPSARWDALTFDDRLFALDPVATPVNPPRRTNTGLPVTSEEQDRDHYAFHAKVGPDGLAGYGTLFK
ncbi:MAG: hypothetical protein HQL36_05315 [Alphaproteobacteria bacterium]|nr:hypothetical protein [Alphaproteobacteria bacterium]